MDQQPRSRLAQVDLNLLVALDALLHERSVTRAGERLSLTQPAMSGTLARLRRLFDDELLVRTGRTMRLTPFAETLEAPLRDILAQVEQTVFSRPDFAPDRHARTFTLLATDYAVLVLIRRVLEALTVEAPHVRVRVEAAGLGSIATHLQRGEVDLALLPENIAQGIDMPSQRLFDDRFVATVWRGNQEVGERLTRRQLAELPYIAYLQSDVRSNADAYLEEVGLGRAADATFESFVLGAFVLRGTRMVTFLQERLVRELADAADIRAAQPPMELPPLIEYMCWHPRATNDPAHRWLRERVAALAAQLDQPR